MKSCVVLKSIVCPAPSSRLLNSTPATAATNVNVPLNTVILTVEFAVMSSVSVVVTVFVPAFISLNDFCCDIACISPANR